MGCYLDPPGYPSYFVQPVYTPKGNNPRKGPDTVMYCKAAGCHKVISDEEGSLEIRLATLRRLWVPLPPDHARTVNWLQHLAKHFRNCYRDEENKVVEKRGGDKTLVYPLPSYVLRHFHDDPRFSYEWRTTERAAVAKHNEELERLAKTVAISENKMGYQLAKRFYPAITTELYETLESQPYSTSTWWERFAKCPTPEECPGAMGCRHPVNNTWCQVCGWHQEGES